MEQKRTLWILLASGIFLLVVIGVALIFYAPEEKKAKTASHPEGNTSIWVDPETSQAEPFRSTLESPASETSAHEESLFWQPEEKEEEPVVSYIDRYENPENTYEEKTPVSEETKETPAGTEKDAVRETVKETVPLYTVEDTDGITTIEITSSPVTAKSEAARKAISIVSAAKKAAEEKSVKKAMEENTSISIREKNTGTYYTDDASVNETKTASAKTGESRTSSKKDSSSEKEAVKEAKASASNVKEAVSSKTSSGKTSKKASAPEEKEPDRFWIQTGSFESRKKADEARKVLTEAGYQCEVFTFRDAKDTLFFRVRVGPYTTKTEADFWKKDISSKLESFKSTQSYITNSTVRK